ncbi:MAG TPA: alpha/beta hydrolase [Mycobacteriales bacterium]|nr:alpha/beta hydrolase [Mycobacteriales bacterium]
MTSPPTWPEGRPRIAGADSRYVAVEGVRFHVHRAAPSRKRRTTPTLLLHGVPETAACWRELMPELAKDRVVIAPDLKGLGLSETREPYDLPTVAAELAALVLHEVDGPVDVVGHDWGGSIALALAGARPDLVRRVVDISGPYRQLNLARAFHVPLFALPTLPEVAFRLGGRRLVEAMFGYAWKAETPLPDDVREHYVASYLPPARVEAMLGYYRAAARPRIHAAVGALLQQAPRPSGPPRVKVERSLVVWGAADPSTGLSDGEAVVRDLGAAASLLSLPGVGHWPLEEAADIVVPAIAEFLRAT